MPRTRAARCQRSRRLVPGLLLLTLAAQAPAKEAPSPEQIAKGKELYAKMCAVCHGPAGEGYRADQAPRIAHPDFLATVNDDYLRRAIAQGRPGTTMSAWSKERGGPLSPAEIDALVALLRSWDHASPVRLDEHALSGDAAHGKEIYAEECASCHGERGVDGRHVHIGSPLFLRGATNGFLRYAIGKGRTGTSMPGYADSLGAARIEDVVALLRSFQVPAAVAEHPPARPAPL